MERVEKNVPLNLFYYILKFGNVWITCFRSLDFRVVPLPEHESPRNKKLQVREVIYVFKIEPYILYLNNKLI